MRFAACRAEADAPTASCGDIHEEGFRSRVTMYALHCRFASTDSSSPFHTDLHGS